MLDYILLAMSVFSFTYIITTFILTAVNYIHNK